MDLMNAIDGLQATLAKSKDTNIYTFKIDLKLLNPCFLLFVSQRICIYSQRAAIFSVEARVTFNVLYQIYFKLSNINTQKIEIQS